MEIPESLHDYIETERVNLQRVEALLQCLAIAYDYCDEEPQHAPDFGYVAKVAFDLLHKSINKLDSLYLDRALKSERLKD